jgi:hypothetical protein
MEAKFETWGTKSEKSENMKTKKNEIKNTLPDLYLLLLHHVFYPNPRIKYTKQLRPNP